MALMWRLKLCLHNHSMAGMQEKEARGHREKDDCKVVHEIVFSNCQYVLFQMKQILLFIVLWRSVGGKLLLLYERLNFMIKL